jgi:hypothetical protein
MARSRPSAEPGTRFVELRPVPLLLRVSLALPFLHDRSIEWAVLHGYLTKGGIPIARSLAPLPRVDRVAAVVTEFMSRVRRPRPMGPSERKPNRPNSGCRSSLSTTRTQAPERPACRYRPLAPRTDSCAASRRRVLASTAEDHRARSRAPRPPCGQVEIDPQTRYM